MKTISHLFREFFYNAWWTEGFVVAALFLAVAIIFTWPLALHITEAIPAGSEPNAVACFQLFSAEWTGASIEGGKSYWNAPFLYPHQGAFAWCEPQPFSCMLIWLLSKLTGYILAYNAVIILYLIGLGLVGYVTSRLLTDDRLAAAWCGIWLCSGAYAIQQICALPLIAAAFPASCLFFSYQFHRSKQVHFFWLALLMYCITWFTFKQGAFYLTLSLIVGLLPFLSLSHVSPKRLVHWLCALLLVFVCVVPFSLSQMRYWRAVGFERRISDITAGLNLSQLFVPAQGHWLASRILGLTTYSWDIGIVPVAVIVLSVYLGILKFYAWNDFQRKMAKGMFAVVCLAVVLGFGPALCIVIAGKKISLYQALFSTFPGVSFIRAPARIIFFAIFGISVFSSFAFAYVRVRIKSLPIRAMVTFLFFVLLAAEMWCVPVNLVFPQRAIESHAAVDSWLSMHGAHQPLLELPSPVKLWPDDIDYEVEAMLRMLKHQNPVVNGYASFSPAPFYQLRKALAADPAGSGRRFLEAYGVRYVLVHNHRLSVQQRETLLPILGSNIVYQDKEHTIYSLPRGTEIQDPGQFLPQVVNIKHPPAAGRFYNMFLVKPRSRALLLMPQDNWHINFHWQDAQEKRVVKTKKVIMRGSLLVDTTDTALFFELLSVPRGNVDAEARLISPRETEELGLTQQLEGRNKK